MFRSNRKMRENAQGAGVEALGTIPQLGLVDTRDLGLHFISNITSKHRIIRQSLRNQVKLEVVLLVHLLLALNMNSMELLQRLWA